jgi:hypothetical protein
MEINEDPFPLAIWKLLMAFVRADLASSKFMKEYMAGRKWREHK